MDPGGWIPDFRERESAGVGLERGGGLSRVGIYLNQTLKVIV